MKEQNSARNKSRIREKEKQYEKNGIYSSFFSSETSNLSCPCIKKFSKI